MKYYFHLLTGYLFFLLGIFQIDGSKTYCKLSLVFSSAFSMLFNVYRLHVLLELYYSCILLGKMHTHCVFAEQILQAIICSSINSDCSKPLRIENKNELNLQLN